MNTQIQWTKPVCQLDSEGIYIGQTEAELDVYAKDGSYLVPGGCIEAEAPSEIPAGKAAKWNGEGWDFIDDHRGQTAYDTATGEAVIIEKAGALSDGLTLELRPSECHKWNAKKKQWQPDPDKQAAKKATLQAAAWERIKTRRSEAVQSGVYVASVQKWFHSDAPSRQQYIFLRTLPALPDNLQWKTIDGSFVQMTKPLLDELSMTLLTAEQADFANAERHRTAMLQADKPEEYDFSGGWSAAPDIQTA
ncbi:DUF4376 domain-containing protein [Neisseria animalis]|uniref:DUF4376 domain-containing protein n=1 Tax=Neisseria animalis TaxID=492 RepID=A0A5P3MQ58_NEIAN|nr:DUF4376 domain-containing protein [Neisseria animalis]QEY23560.1 DUF4376 domain-containing protein [Neisseria animalis]ROW32160.1 DUF4376 domain-containing protein [Neisseria animalis]VEE09220.1 Uncharacterised protein [Neisseria animalis]